MEKQITMEKLKVAFKEIEFNEEIDRESVFLPVLNQVLESYNGLGYSKLDHIAFKELLSNPQSFIFSKMMDGEQWSLGSMKLDSLKAFELIEKPAGVEELINLINEAKKGANFMYHLNNYVLNDDEVVLSPSFVNKATERNTLYAKTEMNKMAVKFIEGVMKLREECFGEEIVDFQSLLAKSITNPSYASPDKSYHIDWTHAVGFRNPM